MSWEYLLPSNADNMKQKRTYLGIIAAFLIIALAYVAWPAEDFTPLVDAEQEAEILSVLPELEEMVEKYPENADAKKDLGHANLLLGNLEDAELYISQALQADPQNPAYILDLGQLYEVRGEYGKAEEAYKTAKELNTKMREDLAQMIESFPPEVGGEAVRGLLEAQDAVQESPLPYAALAKLYLNKLGKTDEAISVLEEGLEANKSYVDFYYLLSSAWEAKGNLEKSQEYRDIIASKNF